MNTITSIRPSEFFKLLQQFDWYHSFSDDGSVLRAGDAGEKELERVSAFSSVMRMMFTAFKQHRTAVISGNKTAPAPVIESFNIGLDMEVVTSGPIQPVSTPLEEIPLVDEWENFEEDAKEVDKRNWLKGFDALKATDAELDNYVQRRTNDYLGVVRAFVAAGKAEPSKLQRVVYGLTFTCHRGIYQTVTDRNDGRGVRPLAFRNVQQMICWILQRYG